MRSFPPKKIPDTISSKSPGIPRRNGRQNAFGGPASGGDRPSPWFHPVGIGGIHDSRSSLYTSQHQPPGGENLSSGSIPPPQRCLVIDTDPSLPSRGRLFEEGCDFFHGAVSCKEDIESTAVQLSQLQHASLIVRFKALDLLSRMHLI